jgi:hypothetical protein
MTGEDVTHVREWLGVDPFALAAVLGVHVSSIYRWEKTKEPNIDPLQKSILVALRTRIKSKRVGEDLGEKLRVSLISGGNLAALHTLLHFVVKGDLDAA